MPTVYEDPAAHHLVLVGELEEQHLSEEIFLRRWRIAVWRHADVDDVYYATEVRVRARLMDAPFTWLDRPEQLTPINDQADFDRFKVVLNEYRPTRHLTGAQMNPEERWERNRRKRLQHKVGKLLYAPNDSFFNLLRTTAADVAAGR